MDAVRENRNIALFIAFLLPIGQFLFQSHLFSLAFGLIILFILAVAFLPENIRLFLWVTITFLIGLFAFIYTERLFYLLPLSELDLYIWSRLLLLIPTFLIAYVTFKFGGDAFFYLKRPGVRFSTSTKLSISIALILLIVSWFVNGNNSSLTIMMKALLFAVINSVAVEVLWRGVLLYRMELLLGKGLAVFFTSLSCALGYYMFGFSLLVCLLLFFLFLYLGTMTTGSQSVWPALVINTITTFILILFDFIPIFHMSV